MKKILALVLALVMVLTAVSAMAAGSKGQSDISTVTAEVEVSKISPDAKLQAVIDAVTAAQKDGDALKGLPGDVTAKIPAERKTINEMSCWQITGDVSTLSKLELKFKFDTPFTGIKQVTLLIGISAPNAEEVEWLVLVGDVNDNNEVVVTVTAAELAKISNNPFIVIPVCE